ncbi:MAG: ubiquinone biosynthesis protein UbiB, partial [Gammaproteobacteria bacterium]|nr:ubiquinone biosynthesis protein UbiB [Gammaproteobacteria bacterium]
SDTLHAMSKGTLQVQVAVRDIDRLADRLDKAASRLTIGLITSALILGTAIVMTVDSGPRLFGLPLLGAVGFIASGIGGLWVLISIFRGR